MPSHMEQTLAIIKPDAFNNRVVGKIIAMIEEQGLRIVAMAMRRLSAEQTRRFYAVHDGKPFFEPLVDFMSSGPCLTMVLEGDNALQRWRTLMGPTDPSKAPDETIRRRYGTDVRFNAVHGSDSAKNARTEIGFFFADINLDTAPSCRKESNT